MTEFIRMDRSALSKVETGQRADLIETRAPCRTRRTSKIGKLQDIEHDWLDALTSVADRIGTDADRAYGSLAQVMRNDQALAQQGQ